MQVRYKINGKDVPREQFTAGNEETLRTMLEAAQPPMSNTDREFLEGRCNGNQFEDTPAQGDFYAGEAKKAGVNTKGKIYLSGLAAFPGDPRAWISGRGDVQKLVEERGWGCDGAVTVPVTKVVEPTGGGVAPDIVDAEAVPLAEETGMKLEDAREKITNLRKPSWVK